MDGYYITVKQQLLYGVSIITGFVEVWCEGRPGPSGSLTYVARASNVSPGETSLSPRSTLPLTNPCFYTDEKLKILLPLAL